MYERVERAMSYEMRCLTARRESRQNFGVQLFVTRVMQLRVRREQQRAILYSANLPAQVVVSRRRVRRLE